MDTTTFPVTPPDAAIIAGWHAAHVADCRRLGVTPQPLSRLSVSRASLGPHCGAPTPVVTTLIGDAPHDVAVIASTFASELLRNGGSPSHFDVTVYLRGAPYLAHVMIVREPSGKLWPQCGRHDVSEVAQAARSERAA